MFNKIGSDDGEYTVSFVLMVFAFQKSNDTHN